MFAVVSINGILKMMFILEKKYYGYNSPLHDLNMFATEVKINKLNISQRLTVHVLCRIMYG